MSSLVRTLIGVCAAVPIALGLFFLMNSLIDRQFEQDEIKAQKVAEIVVPDKEIETNRKEELPEKVEDPDEPPPDMGPLDPYYRALHLFLFGWVEHRSQCRYRCMGK